MGRPHSDNKIERKVYFYRASVDVPVGAVSSLFDPRTVCEQISQLSFETGERYHELENGDAVTVWPDSTLPQVRLRIGRIRRSAFPLRERGGTVAFLQMAEREGLVEYTHVVFFGDGSVGVEYNHFGPRISALSSYIFHIFGQSQYVRFQPLINREAAEQLMHLHDARFVKFRIKRSHISLLREANEESLAVALENNAAELQPDTIEIVMSRRRQGLTDRALDLVRRLIQNPQAHEGLESLQVRGLDDRTGGLQTIDLLREYLVEARRVPRQHARHRVVDTASMYQEIVLAHQDLEEAIKLAAEVIP